MEEVSSTLDFLKEKEVKNSEIKCEGKNYLKKKKSNKKVKNKKNNNNESFISPFSSHSSITSLSSGIFNSPSDKSIFPTINTSSSSFSHVNNFSSCSELKNEKQKKTVIDHSNLNNMSNFNTNNSYYSNNNNNNNNMINQIASDCASLSSYSSTSSCLSFSSISSCFSLSPSPSRHPFDLNSNSSSFLQKHNMKSIAGHNNVLGNSAYYNKDFISSESVYNNSFNHCNMYKPSKNVFEDSINSVKSSDIHYSLLPEEDTPNTSKRSTRSALSDFMKSIFCKRRIYAYTLNKYETREEAGTREKFVKSNFERICSFIREKKKKIQLLIYAVALLIFSIGNTIYFKKMTDSMPNYSWFLSQLTTAVYVPIFFTIILYTKFTGKITPEMDAFPKSRFLLMGCLDAMAGIFSILGGVHTTGTTQVVLQQSAIPLTLFFTLLLLRTRYHWMQYVGSVVIILGVLVVQIPDFASTSSSREQNVLVFNIIFFLGGLPTALSSVYKEIAFKDIDLDINFLQGWVAFFQLVVGFLTFPFNTLKILGAQSITFAEVPYVLLNGSKCLFAGMNSIVHDCGKAYQRPCDACVYAWIPILMYIVFNILYNVFTILIIKHGSAALSFLVATLKLPLTSMAFYSSTIMGDKALKPRATDFYGLGILLIGLISYRYGGTLKKRKSLQQVSEDTEILPLFSTIVEAEPLFVRMHKNVPYHKKLKDNFYRKLRIYSSSQLSALGTSNESLQKRCLNHKSCHKSESVVFDNNKKVSNTSVDDELNPSFSKISSFPSLYLPSPVINAQADHNYPLNTNNNDCNKQDAFFQKDGQSKLFVSLFPSSSKKVE